MNRFRVKENSIIIYSDMNMISFTIPFCFCADSPDTCLFSTPSPLTHCMHATGYNVQMDKVSLSCLSPPFPPNLSVPGAPTEMHVGIA